MLSTVWIALMYITQFPILIPIAVITIANRYIVDRYLLARYYRTPQILDDVLHKASLDLFKIPILLMFFEWSIMPAAFAWPWLPLPRKVC